MGGLILKLLYDWISVFGVIGLIVLLWILLISSFLRLDSYKIFNDSGDEIGFITSGGMSPSLNCGIALAYIDLHFAEELECFKIKIRDNFFDIYKTKLPFYKKGTYLA